MLSNYDVILWDFDGVIMDSMPVRSLGFVKVLQAYPQAQVDELIRFHDINGGLSRYVKFRYFFEEIRKETITAEQVNDLAQQFSEVMLSLLLNAELLITDSVAFIKDNYQKYQMHVVSGSDGNELRFICKELGLDRYFLTINGSPTPKTQLVKQVIADNGYDKTKVALIGDSKNDLDACIDNDIAFYGYNNIALADSGAGYINSFASFAQ